MGLVQESTRSHSNTVDRPTTGKEDEVTKVNSFKTLSWRLIRGPRLHNSSTPALQTSLRTLHLLGSLFARMSALEVVAFVKQQDCQGSAAASKSNTFHF